MKLTIGAFSAELSEANKMLEDKEPLVSLGAQLSKLNSIKNNHRRWMRIYFMLCPKQ